MSVEESLGLVTSRVQSLADKHWVEWCITRPELAHHSQTDGSAPQLSALRQWSMAAETDDDAAVINQTMKALAWLSSKHGGNDEAAATLLAWLMVPAARHLAYRLSYLSGAIDSHIAAELWIQVREPNLEVNAVAANIAGRLRRAVLKDLSGPEVISDEEIERTAARYTAEFEEPTKAMDRLLAVLDLGCAEQIISDDERLLLLDVIVAAAGLPGQQEGFSLLGDEVSRRVAIQWQASPRTIRRMTAAAIDRLSQISLMAFTA
jgi:hypothetical protein